MMREFVARRRTKTAACGIVAAITLVFVVALASIPRASDGVVSGAEYLLRVAPGDLEEIVARHGLGLDPLGRHLGDVHVVVDEHARTEAAIVEQVRADGAVLGFEPNRTIVLPELTPRFARLQPFAQVFEPSSSDEFREFYGRPVRLEYVDQTWLNTIGVPLVHARGRTGAGVVAIIGTGIDPTHPAIADMLVAGFDFTRDLAGSGSELADVSQSTAAILEQSTAAILEQSTAAILEQSTAAILEQSTAAILEQSTAAILEQSTAAILEQPTAGSGEDSGTDSPEEPAGDAPGLSTATSPEDAWSGSRDQSTAAILEQSTAAILESPFTSLSSLSPDDLPPLAFGHGTMVAALVGRIAPTARIMPLKVFQGDGTATLFDIIRAVHFAVEHGARVVDASLALVGTSSELDRAFEYAASQGVVCVAPAGNDASLLVTAPAAGPHVLGVGSTGDEDTRSAFSNLGDEVAEVSAPGDRVVTAWPGGHFGLATGTSFSAAVVAGGAALLVDGAAGVGSEAAARDAAAVVEALRQALPIGPDLGRGRVDFDGALTFREEFVTNR